jgi:predicted phage-related endonuclease
LGISPFSSPAKVAAEKSGLLPMGDEETELMAWGRKVEPLMVETFLEDMAAAGHKGWSAKTSGKMYRSQKPGREIMTTTLDGTVVDPDGRPGVMECKLKIFGSDEWVKHGIPDYVIAQTQHAVEVMDWSFSVVIGLLDGYRPRWKILERNDELIEDVIVPAELDFWRRWEAGEAFPLDQGPTGVNLNLVKRLYPEDNGKTVALKGEHYLAAARQWRTAALEKLAAKHTVEKSQAVLRDAMAGATYAILDNGTRLSLKTTKKKASVQSATSYRTLREMKHKASGR